MKEIKVFESNNLLAYLNKVIDDLEHLKKNKPENIAEINAQIAIIKGILFDLETNEFGLQKTVIVD